MLSSNKIFASLCLGSAMTLALYVYWAGTRVADTPNTPDIKSTRDETASRPEPAQTEELATSPSQTPSVGEMRGTEPRREARRKEPAGRNPGSAASSPPAQVFFRHNGLDSHYGRLAFVQLDGGREQPQFIDSLSCDVAYVAGGRGICLTANRGVFTTYAAKLFDGKTFQILSEFPLNGVPSRSRVSVDGRTAALTVFISGHGYDSLDFSTQTLLVDIEQGRVIADLEEFSVTRDGKPLANKDFNFWGVTFTPDAAHFYATLSTNRQYFLVKGDIAGRSAVVVHADVECPSLSPNGARVAYKKRSMEGNRVAWQLYVLDLETRRETPLGERRSVDDQLEWLDNDHVLYTLPATDAGPTASTNVWLAAADGTSAPKLFLRRAYSPAVVPRVAESSVASKSRSTAVQRGVVPAGERTGPTRGRRG